MFNNFLKEIVDYWGKINMGINIFGSYCKYHFRVCGSDFVLSWSLSLSDPPQLKVSLF